MAKLAVGISLPKPPKRIPPAEEPPPQEIVVTKMNKMKMALWQFTCLEKAPQSNN